MYNRYRSEKRVEKCKGACGELGGTPALLGSSSKSPRLRARLVPFRSLPQTDRLE